MLACGAQERQHGVGLGLSFWGMGVCNVMEEQLWL